MNTEYHDVQRVRIAALKYLAVLPSLVKYDVLHPQKSTVLRELANALDDPKRSVRKEAVEARYVPDTCLLMNNKSDLCLFKDELVSSPTPTLWYPG